jgi:glutamine synthetase
MEWAIEHGASSFCHWFQPLGSTMLRHGQTAQVQVNMVRFSTKGKPVWSFKGCDLIQSETDGSSYLNGGLRSTHSAGGYLVIDPTSPVFLRGDCIHIPACFVSYLGQSLDEKTPLLRACEALSREGVRLLGLLGYHVKSVHACIGLEQELFLVPRSAYLRRPDLQLSGRTIVGKKCARRQELNDHCKLC